MSKRKRFTLEIEDQIIQMYQQGCPMNDIYQKYDFQPRLLYSIIRGHGLYPSRRKQKSPGETFICPECGETKKQSERSKGYRICLPCIRKRVMRTIMKNKYGISEAEYEKQLAKQRGKCAICGKEFDFKNKNIDTIHIDHCHTTGRLRGLLCGECNKGIGFFHDSPELLLAAINYLKNHENFKKQK
ncbi:MAG: endonuclease VII domain-containing protein [Candidatus Sumerlaeota bacterium]|nr:endonuclease VII domain-containing protein [Candidatus Sumerlaeota bacterium]